MTLAATSLGDILNPLFTAVASILAFFYAVIPNYAVAIALLTIAIMLIVSPLTLKSTRSMVAMQRLAPEMKKLQQKYKGDRQRLNEEMMKFYKENNVSPLGGCLPMVLQLPAFFVMYQVIRGLTNVPPKYISHSTELYHHLVASHGQMMSFGIDLSKSATAHHTSFAAALPYYIMIIAAIGLQYLQMRQLNGRNPQAAAANPQMQKLTRYMPLVFGFIYIGIPAAVNIYFLVSSLFRIGQQELMFRYDPVVRRLGPFGIAAKATEVDPGARGRRGLGKGARVGDGGEDEGEDSEQRGADAAPQNGGATKDGRAAEDGRGDGRGKERTGQRGNGRGSNGSGRPSRSALGGGKPSENGGAKKSHSRSQSKRRRKAR
jgi:YidC/Oxa1 family membrane protein insertase